MKTYLVYLVDVDQPIEVTGKSVTAGGNFGFADEQNEPVAVFMGSIVRYFIVKPE